MSKIWLQEQQHLNSSINQITWNCLFVLFWPWKLSKCTLFWRFIIHSWNEIWKAFFLWNQVPALLSYIVPDIRLLILNIERKCQLLKWTMNHKSQILLSVHSSVCVVLGKSKTNSNQNKPNIWVHHISLSKNSNSWFSLNEYWIQKIEIITNLWTRNENFWTNIPKQKPKGTLNLLSGRGWNHSAEHSITLEEKI